jgi:hypothetical protein
MWKRLNSWSIGGKMLSWDEWSDMWKEDRERAVWQYMPLGMPKVLYRAPSPTVSDATMEALLAEIYGCPVRVARDVAEVMVRRILAGKDD